MFVSVFIEYHSRFEYGLVNHALCAAVRDLVHEFTVLVTQLEAQFRLGQLTIQKLWFYVQPSLKSLRALFDLTLAVKKGSCRGGALLSLLHDLQTCAAGDATVQTLYAFLLKKASVPFFEQLSQWLYKGQVVDPYLEFMIEEQKSVRKESVSEDYNDTYWEQRYQLRLEHVPRFMDALGSKILTTGKYLNVLQECGMPIEQPSAAPKGASQAHWMLDSNLSAAELTAAIEAAHAFASTRLLEVLVGPYRLLERLGTLKHYFLLDRGDFLVHFLDMADAELGKLRNTISVSKLQSLWELAVRSGCSFEGDTFRDDLRCQLSFTSLVDQLLRIISISSADGGAEPAVLAKPETLSGFDCFSLDFKVRWPISLILNRKSMTKYQMLFRHLFYFKHLERQLSSSWAEHKTAKRLHLRQHPLLVKSVSLRQRMLSFLQNFQYYILFEVVEPNWRTFVDGKMAAAANVDELLRYHQDFLDTCLKEAMLTNPKLLKIVHKISVTCLVFAGYSERLMRTISGEFGKASLSTTLSDEGLDRAFQRYNENFLYHLKLLIEALNFYSATDCEHHMTNLIARLDFNDFYSTTLPSRMASLPSATDRLKSSAR